MPLSTTDLAALYRGAFADLLSSDWLEWREGYLKHVSALAEANAETWREPTFQQRLWDDASVSSIGPGQSVTLVDAYVDSDLAEKLLEARGMLAGLPLDERGTRLQSLYDEVLAWVYPRYTPRRPKARLVRMLSGMFPQDMTCLMDATRTSGVQRALGLPKAPGDFVAQNPSIRDALRKALGTPDSIEQDVDHSMFTWFLCQNVVERPEEGSVQTQPLHREANSVPPFSLMPATAQRRSLTCVRDNVPLLVAMLRESEQGISREDLVAVILSEATQLNASSAPNMISQAMGGLGLLRLEGSTYRPTERGLEMLTAPNPAHVLRGPLVGRVFGMGHLLRMIEREPGALKPIDASNRLKDLVPSWTSTQPGSYILAWARLTGMVQLDGSAGGGRLVLTEDGEDYAAALPEDFEQVWRIDPPEAADGIEEGAAAEPQRDAPKSLGASEYGIPQIVADGCFMPEQELSAAIELLRRKKNLILQGPPGTGKTWLAKRLGYALLGALDTERLIAVQFQPSLSYEDFVRGWRPDGNGGLRLADGIFLDAVSAAHADPKRPFVLVIEEINRGNPAQILGELLTLIEDGKRRPEEALRLTYARSVDERVHVPPNLHIIGTMNLADRSLALVDLALRRRFAFMSLVPLLNEAWRGWALDRGCPGDLLDGIAWRIDSLNAAITADRTLGDQFRIGHSFVTPVDAPGATSGDWHGWFDEVVRTEIGPLLEEYWYDRPDEAAARIAALRI